MCLHPQLIPPVPEETARVAKAAFPKGNRYMRLRDELGIFYHDEDFAELYPERGQGAIAQHHFVIALLGNFEFANSIGISAKPLLLPLQVKTAQVNH
jgi:hypothetical protein